MQKTGSEIICESIIKEGVTTIFGYPGGTILPFYDTLPKYKQTLRHILTRHEQGAAFAAQGWARTMESLRTRSRGMSKVSRKVGVCIATSGPGVTNLVTGIADAYLDSIPIIAITGQVGSSLIGTDAFQEVDATGITLPITKHNYLVTDASELPRVMKEAFYIARTGRPGPVHIDVTKDAQIGRAEFNSDKIKIKVPGYLIRGPAGQKQVKNAAKIIREAKRPVIITGGGVVASGASRELLAFARRINAAIVSTIHGNSSIPFDTRHYYGMLGMHGLAAANYATAHADVVISVGARFDDRITGKVDEFAKYGRVVHIDIDAAEIGKIIPIDAPIVADARDALMKLNKILKPQKHPDWHRDIEAYEVKTTKAIRASQKKPAKLLRAYEVIHAINEVAPDAVIVTDVGQHQMWTAMNFRFRYAGQFLTSGGLGTMGFGLPTALGAKVARPEKSVWCISGDGSIQMNIQELTTLVQDGINVKIAVFRNNFLGMVRQWQELFYDRNYSATPLLCPDFVKLAEACGIRALRVTKPSDALRITRQAEKIRGPVLVEYLTEPEENVFPMVPPGMTLRNTRIK